MNRSNPKWPRRSRTRRPPHIDNGLRQSQGLQNVLDGPRALKRPPEIARNISTNRNVPTLRGSETAPQEFAYSFDRKPNRPTKSSREDSLISSRSPLCPNT